jgi:hypothetical protein
MQFKVVRSKVVPSVAKQKPKPALRICSVGDTPDNWLFLSVTQKLEFLERRKQNLEREIQDHYATLARLEDEMNQVLSALN